MADLIHRTNRDSNGALLEKFSVNTPDFSPASWIINPDLSGVDGIAEYYWKTVGDNVVEMDAGEKTTVDAVRLSDAKTTRQAYLRDRGTSYQEERYSAGDQNILRTLFSESQGLRPNRALYIKPWNIWVDEVATEVKTQVASVDSQTTVNDVNAVVLDEATLTSNDPLITVDDALGVTDSLIAPLLNGARAVWNSVSTIGIGTAGDPSVVSDIDGKGSIGWSGELAADITVAGAGGLDTGSEAADTWYAVFVIGDTTQTNSPTLLLSTSVTAPTMPAGYDMKRLVWFVRNSSTSDLHRFMQTGKNATRICWWNESSTSLRPLNNGSADAWTDVDCSAEIPPTSEVGTFQISFETGNSGNAADDVGLRPDGITTSPWTCQVGVASNQKGYFQLTMPVSTSQVVEYQVSDSVNNQATIVVVGWVVDL